MRLLEEVRQYRHLLNWSVIPVRVNSKVAAVSWKKYQTDLMGKGEVETVFADGALNVALVTGELSGVVVVDADDYKAKGGTITLASPLFATTPRGGRHLYFRHNKAVQNSVNADQAVDVRGDGGYVLLPPSVIDGKRYSWNVRPTPELLASLPVLPDEVLQTLRKQPAAPTPTAPGQPASLLAAAIGTGEGSRDDTLLRAAESLLNGLPEHEWSSAGYLAIQGVNQTFQPPLPEADVQRIYRQASNFVRTNPKQRPPELAATVAVTLPGWQPKSWSERLREFSERRKRGEEKGIPCGFGALDDKLLGIQPGQTYLFFGDTNTGKSCLMLNMLLRMADAGNQVTYFDLENNGLMTTERMILIRNEALTKTAWGPMKYTDEQDAYMDDLAGLPVHLEEVWSLYDRFGAISIEAIETVIREQAAKGCKIFGLDHLHYFEKAETEHKHLEAIARRLNDIASQLSVAILIVAHTKKGLVKREGADSVAVVRPTVDDVNGGTLIVKHTKNVIGIMRNGLADDPVQRGRTVLFLDKTKTGNVGKVLLHFDHETLRFKEVAS
jgi:hypothetical protein